MPTPRLPIKIPFHPLPRLELSSTTKSQNLKLFKSHYFTTPLPVHIPQLAKNLPAHHRWFCPPPLRQHCRDSTSALSGQHVQFLDTKYLRSRLEEATGGENRSVHDLLVDVESTTSASPVRFARGQMALVDFLDWIDWQQQLHLRQLQEGNEERGSIGMDSARVSHYISQSPLSNLPPLLLDDVPAPMDIIASGRGDVYASSIWMGWIPRSLDGAGKLAHWDLGRDAAG